MTDNDMAQKLLERIKGRRASIYAYVHEMEPRGDRLTNMSVVCSALVTALTAGPALGGTQFTEAIQALIRLPDDAPVWRVLCLAAVILSIVAAISTNLYKSHDVASRLAKAQASGALLEGLETAIEFGQLSLQDATKLYQQYIAEVAFIPERQNP